MQHHVNHRDLTTGKRALRAVTLGVRRLVVVVVVVVVGFGDALTHVSVHTRKILEAEQD